MPDATLSTAPSQSSQQIRTLQRRKLRRGGLEQSAQAAQLGSGELRFPPGCLAPARCPEKHRQDTSQERRELTPGRPPGWLLLPHPRTPLRPAAITSKVGLSGGMAGPWAGFGPMCDRQAGASGPLGRGLGSPMGPGRVEPGLCAPQWAEQLSRGGEHFVSLIAWDTCWGLY